MRCGLSARAESAALMTWVILNRLAPALVLAFAALGALLARALRDAVGRKS